MEQPLSTIRVSLDIPSQRLMTQAMDIGERYKKIITDAIEEVRAELPTSTLLKDAIVKKLKSELAARIEKEIENAVSSVVSTVIWDNYDVIKDSVSKIVKSAIKPKED